MRKIFVTGCRGFIGYCIVHELARNGLHVIGCDLQMHAPSEWQPLIGSASPHSEHLTSSFRSGERGQLTDFRKATQDDLANVSCVLHLAGLANEPSAVLLGHTYQKHYLEDTVEFARLACKAGVRDFIFASSCSVYEHHPPQHATEYSALSVTSPYARSKLEVENALTSLKSKHFNTTSLRIATAYGMSSAMRLDLVVNAMIFSAISDKKIYIMGDRKRFRPLVRADVLASIVTSLILKPELLRIHRVINAGVPEENYTLEQIARHVQTEFDGTILFKPFNKDQDNRSYRVSFDRLSNLLPWVNMTPHLADAISNMAESFREFANYAVSEPIERFRRVATTCAFFDRIENTTAPSAMGARSKAI